ncbi:hypothetical protein ACSSS7_004819 [Eimeria intestinalis]
MEGEGRIWASREPSASQLAWSGPVDHLTNVRAAVEEFSNSSSVNSRALKHPGAPPRYVWAAVLSVTAALTIAFVLRKCFNTLSQAVESNPSGPRLKGSASFRQLSERDSEQCNRSAWPRPRALVTWDNTGNGGEALISAEEPALVEAEAEGSGDEAPLDEGSEISESASSLRTSHSDESATSSFFSAALRWFCCTFCCVRLWATVASPDMAGLESENYGAFRRRSSNDSVVDAWAGVYVGESEPSLLASEEEEADANLGTDGGAPTRVGVKSSEEGLKTDWGSAESADEVSSPGVRIFLFGDAQETVKARSERRGSGEELVVAARSGSVVVRADEAGETEGGSREGEQGKEPADNSGFVVVGAGVEGGREGHFPRHPKHPASLRGKRIDDFTRTRHVRERLVASASWGSTPPASPQKTQRDETPGEGSDTPPDRQFIKKAFGATTSLENILLSTDNLPGGQPAKSSTGESRVLEAPHERKNVRPDLARVPASSASEPLTDGVESKHMTSRRSLLLLPPGSFAQRKESDLTVKIPRHGPPGQDEPLSSMIARGVPKHLIEEEKKRRREEVKNQLRAETERLQAEFIRAWLKGFSYFAFWLAKTDEDVFESQ